MTFKITSENKAISSSLRIHWVTQGIEEIQSGVYVSDLASNRYRAIIPAQELRTSGHSVDFIDAPKWQWNSVNQPDLVILGKLLPADNSHNFSNLSKHILCQTHHAALNGIPVIADFNDNHFDHPLLGSHWIQTAKAATVCTAASQRMAEVVQRFTKKPVFFVSDPIASPIGAPKVFRQTGKLTRLISRLVSFLGPNRLKLIWYGHPSNWAAMERWETELVSLSQNYPLLLWVITSSSETVHRWIERFNVRYGPAALAEWVDWSESTQWTYLNESDAVLIPSDLSDSRLNVKSSNRMTDALNAGRYVVASAIPSYLAFKDFCSLTEEPAEALQWMIKNQKAALARVSQGQKVARDLSSTSSIAQKWLDVGLYAIKNLSQQDSYINDDYIQHDLFVHAQAIKPNSESKLSQPMSIDSLLLEPSLILKDNIAEIPSLLDLHINNIGKVSDKWELYFSIYENLFLPLRDKAVNLLEIGVQNGGSLEVWAQFFTNSNHIIGCDINPSCQKLQFDDPRISLVIGDINLPAVHARITEVSATLDIIIDDGSNESADIIQSFLLYFNSLNNGGLYIVEDLHAIYRKKSPIDPTFNASALNFFKVCVEFLNFEHWGGNNEATALFAPFVSYGVDFPSWLKTGVIGSIEFYNSMIVIRKSLQKNRLGRRFVSGKVATVHPGIMRHQASTGAKSNDIEESYVATPPEWSHKLKSTKQLTHDQANLIRLNLGCGDKLLDGYINIDITPARNGKSPDVLCDIKKLNTFESNYADEILAVHVIEHFYRWEVEDILQEWIRVLRPGGKLIIECPNLTTACQELLKNTASHALPSKEGQRTMWSFYGDPSWKDPLMIHRWAYTQESLSALLTNAGLTLVQQEPAEFKLREPRDMRITGRKPENINNIN